MADSSIAVDVNQALDVLGYLSAQLSLHSIVPGDELTNPAHFTLGQVADPCVRVHADAFEDVVASRAPDPMDVRESDLNALVLR
jgi:hypothetical protein